MLDTDNHKSGKGPICRVLGIGAADSTLRTKFCAVFPMGTGMDDITDFREFIYHYIFPQLEIDPQALQQEQIKLDHLNDVLLQAKERAQLLTEIGRLGKTPRAKQRDCTINRGFVLYARQRPGGGADPDRHQQWKPRDRTPAGRAAESAGADRAGSPAGDGRLAGKPEQP